MIPKKNKGSALIVVLMVMAVMAILGVSILNISLSQTKQAAYEDKRIQAHYLARSGAEATLSAWINPGENKPKPSGTCKGYLDISNEFKSVDTSHQDIPPDAIGNFVVTVLPGKQIGVTVIKSVADVGDVEQTVTVTITTAVPIPPLEPVDGGDEGLRWYDDASGQINTNHNDPGPPGEVVEIKAKELGNSGKVQDLKLPNKAATFEADQMHFISQIKTLHNRLTLKAKLIAFDKPVDGFDKGELVLKVLDDGFKPNGSHFTGPVGVIYLGEVGYYFKDVEGGIPLNNSSGIEKQVKAKKLEKITDPNFKNPFLPNYTQPAPSSPLPSIIWS